MENIKILFEDGHIIVCEKPAGVPAQSDKSGSYDMVNRLKNYIYEKEAKKGPPYLGIVHRLDRPVGGLMVFAKTPWAAGELSSQIQKGKMNKKYLAVIQRDLSGQKEEKEIMLRDFLLKNGRTNLSEVVTAQTPGAKLAELYYRIVEVSKEGNSLAEVALLTGRHHQIRVQMAFHEMPLWGDTKYNTEFQQGVQGKSWFSVGLYSYRLSFLHPKTKKNMEFECLPDQEPFDQFMYIKKP